MYPTWEEDVEREWRWYHTAMLLVLIPIVVACMTLVLFVDSIRPRRRINARINQLKLNGPLEGCQAGRDGDCISEQCPQRAAYQSHCPLPHWTDDPEY